MSQFVIYDSKSGEFWWRVVGMPYVFPDAAAATAVLREISKNWGGPCGFAIRQVDGQIDVQWLDKARRARESGEWGRPDYVALMEASESHFLRLSPDAGKTNGAADLMFYKNAFAGMTGKLSNISLRGYLEKYRDMRTKDMDYYEIIHRLETSGNDGLLFASKPDDIVSVYTRYNPGAAAVGSSCMRHGANDFKSHWGCPVHPTYVYGAGDLAVAYLADHNGYTIARAICWPDKKVYSRVYDGTDLLHRALKKRGFVKSGRYYSDAGANAPNLGGAKLLRILHKDPKYEGCFVMPYIDEDLTVRDAGDHFVLSNDRNDKRPAIVARYVSGWNMESPSATIVCECCGNRTRETYEVRDAQAQRHNWCQICAENKTFTCSATNLMFDLTTPSVTMRGVRVSAWAADPNNGYVLTCPLTGNVFLRGRGVSVFTTYSDVGVRNISCDRSVMLRDDLVWRDCFTNRYFKIADVPREKVLTNEHEWRWTSPTTIATGAAFRSDYNGKLYDIRYERYVQRSDGTGKLYRVSSTHFKGAKQRLDSGKPIGGGAKEPEADKEDD